MFSSFPQTLHALEDAIKDWLLDLENSVTDTPKAFPLFSNILKPYYTHADLEIRTTSCNMKYVTFTLSWS